MALLKIAFEAAARASSKSKAEFAAMMIAVDAAKLESKAGRLELEQHRRIHAK